MAKSYSYEAAVSQWPHICTPLRPSSPLTSHNGGKKRGSLEKSDGTLLPRAFRSSLMFSALRLALPTLVLISSVLKKTSSLGAT